MAKLSEFCAENSQVISERFFINRNISLKLVSFIPRSDTQVSVVFIPGLVSLMSGWQRVLKDMSKTFKIYYLETREKKSSEIKGKTSYDIESIGKDIISLISYLGLKSKDYILFGSSLGATAILDCCRFLKVPPRCLVLIGPNAYFRIPKWAEYLIRFSPSGLYLAIKPFVKWYLKKFRLNIKCDYSQYEKYCQNLDAVDPGKLKKMAISLVDYQVWQRLDNIIYPTLIFGASKDILHEPDNIKKMAAMIKNACYIDLETNYLTHSEKMVAEMRKFIRSL